MIPASNSTIVRREKRVRSPLGQVVKWAFIAFNLFMLYCLVARLSNAGKQLEGMSGAAKDGGYLGATIGAGLLLTIWTMGAVILGLFTLLTRGQTVVIEEGGPPQPVSYSNNEPMFVRPQAEAVGDRPREAASVSEPAPQAAQEAPRIALVDCEACGRQVSSAAAACPSCGHPVSRAPTIAASAPQPAKEAVWSNYEATSTYEPEKPSRAGLFAAWGAIAAVALGAIVWIANQSGSGSYTGQSHNAPIEVAIGEPVEFNIYTVTVSNVVSGKALPSVAWNVLLGQSSFDDLRNLAPEGTLFVIVDYTVLNSGQKPLPAGSRPNIQLQDQNGAVLNPDAGRSASENAYVGSQKLVSDLNPGIAEKARAIFEVSEAQFDQKTWKVLINGQAIVSLASMGDRAASKAQGGKSSTEAPKAERYVFHPSHIVDANFALEPLIGNEIRFPNCKSTFKKNQEPSVALFMDGNQLPNDESPWIAVVRIGGRTIELALSQEQYSDGVSTLAWTATSDADDLRIMQKETGLLEAKALPGGGRQTRVELHVMHGGQRVAFYDGLQNCVGTGNQYKELGNQ